MPGWEILAVIVIVAVATVWAGRAIWRSARSGKICSTCSDSGSCPVFDNPQLLESLVSEGKSPATERPGADGVSCPSLKTFSSESQNK